MVRMFIYILLIYFGYLILKSLTKHLLRGGRQSTEYSSNQSTELIKDPQCGAYFMRQRGVAVQIEGKTIIFCSKSCRDAYVKDRLPR